VQALWFSGFVRGWRDERRTAGQPPRRFFDDEIVLQIVAGAVVRARVLDLRAVPEQTDEELQLLLPRFLWPGRLKGW
jgi:hypothetical protein